MKIHLGAVPRHHADRKAPGAVAIRCGEDVLTWRELDEQSNRRARALLSAGVKPGDFVSIALDNGLAFYETTFAVWKAGAIPNPISARLPIAEASAIVALANPRVVVADSRFAVPYVPVLTIDADLTRLASSPLDTPPPVPHWRALTSGGSTGRSKIIVDHHPAETDPTVTYMGQSVDGVILIPGPLYHTAPFVHGFLGLFSGNELVVMPRFDAEAALRLIAEHRVTWVNFVPTMMHRIWALPDDVKARYDLDSLTGVWHGAAPMPVWLKERWIDWIGAEKIWEVYGGTENQGRTIIGGVEWLEHRGSVGRAAPGTDIAVFREDGVLCEAGEVGEIYFYAGGKPAYHYVGAEAKRLAGDWETIGDLGWMDEQGYLYISDRRVDLILRGGANVYPAEVEAALDAHPGVASSAVIGLPHPDLGQTVHAIVQPRKGCELDIDDLADFVSLRLAKYKAPASFEFSPDPLRDDAGKVRRSALRATREAWLAEGVDFQQRRRAPAKADS